MKKVLIAVCMLLTMLAAGRYAYAVGPGESIIDSTPMKGNPITLYSGQITASVSLANSDEIDMTRYNGGILSMVLTSGTGTWNVVVDSADVSGGQYVPANILKSDYSGYVAYPAITTTASTSGSWLIKDVRAHYLKLVPTLTGAASATFTFTPSRN